MSFQASLGVFTSGGRTLHGRAVLAGALAFAIVLWEPLFWNADAVAQSKRDLRIAILKGNNKVIKKNSTLQLVVEVRDELQTPVPGAQVTFIAPDFGPGALFAGNQSQLTVLTDTRGRASADAARSVGGNGPFSVTILAMSQGGSATTSAQATNQSPDGSSPSVKKKSNKLTWILIAAAGGAAGAALAMKGKSGSSSGSSSGGGATGGGGLGLGGTTTVTPGAPTVGAPQ